MYSILASGLTTLPMATLFVGSESAMYAAFQVFASGASDLDSSKPVQMVEKDGKASKQKDQSQKTKVARHCVWM